MVTPNGILNSFKRGFQGGTAWTAKERDKNVRETNAGIQALRRGYRNRK